MNARVALPCLLKKAVIFCIYALGALISTIIFPDRHMKSNFSYFRLKFLIIKLKLDMSVKGLEIEPKFYTEQVRDRLRS